jgi:hypothetical protein
MANQNFHNLNGFNNLPIFQPPQSMALTTYLFYGMIMQPLEKDNSHEKTKISPIPLDRNILPIYYHRPHDGSIG